MNANPQDKFPTSQPGAPAEAGPADAGQYIQVRLPQRKPYVTYSIIGVTVLVFLLQQLSTALIGGDLLAALGDKNNAAIQTYAEYWRFFTPMLLHANLLHIGFNMYALYIFGPNLERFYGHYRYLGLYVLAGFCGNVLSFIFTTSPSLGASTAIFGLIAAEGIFIYRNRFLHGQNVRAMLTNIVILIIINLALGLSPGIDNFGHLGGLVGGAAFAWFAGPRFQVGGIPPNFHLLDERPVQLQWLVLGAVFAVFAALAAAIIITR